MLINLTNHPYNTWSDSQKQSAEQYGDVIDWTFPVIDPGMSGVNVKQLASDILNQMLNDAVIYEHYLNKTITIHIQGEQVFVFHLVRMLLDKGIPCLASTSVRKKTDLGNGKTEQQFQFVQFRAY